LRTPGFSLVELLVVVGIVALLAAILLPVLSHAREAARRANCASRLRQLVAATQMYLNDCGVYPEPPVLPPLGGAVPCALQAGIVNRVSATMRQPPVMSWHSIDGLPAVFRCPAREQFALYEKPDLSMGVPWWHTGYMYCARLIDEPGPTAKALKPERIARARGQRRSVIWADTLFFGRTGPEQAYAYFHFYGTLDIGPLGAPMTPTTLRGQHRASSNGSVEWFGAKALDLDPTHVESSATYLVGPRGSFELYFYF
jgi:prepilin-type N-terminal cleavage/methylation domain-containing protein